MLLQPASSSAVSPSARRQLIPIVEHETVMTVRKVALVSYGLVAPTSRGRILRPAGVGEGNR